MNVDLLQVVDLTVDESDGLTDLIELLPDGRPVIPLEKTDERCEVCYGEDVELVVTDDGVEIPQKKTYKIASLYATVCLCRQHLEEEPHTHSLIEPSERATVPDDIRETVWEAISDIDNLQFEKSEEYEQAVDDILSAVGVPERVIAESECKPGRVPHEVAE